MSDDYKPGEDPVLDQLMDEFGIPEAERPIRAAWVRATFGYQRKKLAEAVGGLASDSLDEIRRRLHREDN